MYWVNVGIFWTASERAVKALQFARVPVAGDMIELMPKVFALVSSVSLYSHFVESGPVARAQVEFNTINDYGSRVFGYFLEKGWELDK